MPIIKSKDVIEVEQITKDLAKVRGEVDKLTKSNEALSTSLQTVKKSSDGKEAEELTKKTNKLTKSTKKLKDLRTDAQIVAEKLVKQNRKLKETYTPQAKALEILKQKTLLQNKALREQAKAQLGVQKSSNGLQKAFRTMTLKLVGAFAAIQGLRGAFNLLKNTIGSTAEGQIFLAKVTGAANTVMATFRDNIIDGWNSLVDFNSEIEDTRTLLEKLGDGFFDFYSVRGAGFIKFIDAGSQILKGDFKDALTSLTDGFVQVALGIEDATEKSVELLNQIKIMAAFGAAIAESEKRLELDRSRFAIQEAKDVRTIADLRVKAADKASFSGKERQGFLERALAITQKLGAANENFANRELALQQAVFNANKSNIDDEIELNKLKQKADEVAAASLKKQKLLTAELQTAKNEAAKENEANYNRENSTIDLIASKKLTTEQETQDDLTSIVQDGIDRRAQIEEDKKEEDLIKIEEWAAAAELIKEQAFTSGQQLASDIFSSFQDEKLAKLRTDADAEIAILQQRLDDGVISEEQFASQVAAIEQKQRTESAKAEKKKALFDIAIATAVGIIKALAALRPGLAIAIGVAGGIQAAAVIAKPIPKFNKGVELVPGEGNQDTVHALLTPGERVVPAEINQMLNGIPNSDLPKLLNKQDNTESSKLSISRNKLLGELVTLMGNMGWTYEEHGERVVTPANGSLIKKFKI